MAGKDDVVRSSVSRGPGSSHADVVLEDGRTGHGDKVSGFFGLEKPDEKDDTTALSRAIDDARSKPRK